MAQRSELAPAFLAMTLFMLEPGTTGCSAARAMISFPGIPARTSCSEMGATIRSSVGMVTTQSRETTAAAFFPMPSMAMTLSMADSVMMKSTVTVDQTSCSVVTATIRLSAIPLQIMLATTISMVKLATMFLGGLGEDTIYGGEDS